VLEIVVGEGAAEEVDPVREAREQKEMGVAVQEREAEVQEEGPKVEEALVKDVVPKIEAP
jgi:hypothetical protein